VGHKNIFFKLKKKEVDSHFIYSNRVPLSGISLKDWKKKKEEEEEEGNEGLVEWQRCRHRSEETPHQIC